MAERAGIEFQPNRKQDPKRRLVLQRLAAEGLDLTAGVEDAVLRMYTEAGREGPWAQPLTAFLKARKITLTPLRRGLVLQELDRLNLDPTSGQDFDQTIAAAVARVTAAGGTDPVQLTAPSGRLSPWDFQVDLFDSVANQIILAGQRPRRGRADVVLRHRRAPRRLPPHRRAGLPLVDRRARLRRPRPHRPAVPQLQAARRAPEPRTERFLLYRRILNIGNAPVGHRVVVNEEFPQLWRTLMEEVAIFIDKSESSFRDNQVNRQGIEQAVQEVAVQPHPDAWPAWRSRR